MVSIPIIPVSGGDIGVGADIPDNRRFSKISISVGIGRGVVSVPVRLEASLSAGMHTGSSTVYTSKALSGASCKSSGRPRPRGSPTLYIGLQCPGWESPVEHYRDAVAGSSSHDRQRTSLARVALFTSGTNRATLSASPSRWDKSCRATVASPI